MISGCSISQNFTPVIFRGYMYSSSVDPILPRYLLRVPKFSLGTFNISPGNCSRKPQFCLGNLDLPSNLPRISTLMLHPVIYLAIRSINMSFFCFHQLNYLYNLVTHILGQIFDIWREGLCIFRLIGIPAISRHFEIKANLVIYQNIK